MKIIQYIIIFLVVVSCKKDESVVNCSSEKYIWPTKAWSTKKPIDLGMEKSYLDSLHSKIKNGNYGNVHSLLVIKDGYLVFENYYNSSSVNQSHELQSATKSISSILCGIAIDKNYFAETDFVLNYIDTNYLHDNNSLQKHISIRDMLTMRLGIDWKEWGYPISQKDNVIMANSSDWIQYILNKPMAMKSDSTFLYNTGASTFISALLDENTSEKTKDFSNQFLFSPIGITSQNWWVQDSKGIVHTGGGLKMIAQDMARFGFLILKNGKWDEKQVVSKNYLSKIKIPATFDVLSVPVNSIPQTLHYGYHWWQIPMVVNGKNYDIIAAMGTGGQCVFVIKELNMVVVSTAWNLTEPNQTSSPLEWLKNFIIPSAE